MQTMDNSLLELYQKGLISRETVLSQAVNQDIVKRYILQDGGIMLNYKYKAVSESGQTIEGYYEAQSEAEVISMLKTIIIFPYLQKRKQAQILVGICL